MFGYVAIDKTKLTDNEVGLYQTFMCGLCLSTKKLYGNYARNFVNYDVNFLNVLLHSMTQEEVVIYTAKCLSSPLKKRTLLTPDAITDRLSSANVLLAYFNVYDDVIDGGGMAKKLLLNSLKSAYAKAKAKEPELNAAIESMYEQLRNAEKSNSDNLDKVCHFFAKLTQTTATMIGGEDSNLSDLAYNLGKWVYLIDALDDYDKDVKRGNYNPLVAYFKQGSRAELLTTCKDELSFLFYTCLNRIAECYNDMNLSKYVCLLNNVLYEQIRNKTKQLLEQQ